MRALFFLPALIPLLLYFANAVVQDRKEARKQREAEERRKARAEAAARAKAERDAQKAAAKAAREAEAAAQPKRKRGRPRKEPAPVVHQPAPEPVQPQPIQPEPIRPVTVSAAPLPFKGNNAFAGEVVAFTGVLDGMTRAEAIKAVEANGGRAFDTMPAGTTILVVGDKPGMNKLDKADRWIGQVRKITQEQFKAKLALPLTLTPDAFAAHFAPVEQ